MQDDFIQDDSPSIVPIWQTMSIASVKPYLKAIGLVTTLMMTWAGLCAI
jgi:hypothetical protein